MLTVDFVYDQDVLKALFKKLNYFAKESKPSVNLVLFEDEMACGLCVLTIGDFLELEHFQTQSDDTTVKEFFFRAVLYKLSFNKYLLRLKKYDARLERYGFVKNALGGMEIDTTKVVFPSDCCHK